jgi:hypothetical protein
MKEANFRSVAKVSRSFGAGDLGESHSSEWLFTRIQESPLVALKVMSFPLGSSFPRVVSSF